ncbi:hypothetical protein [Bacillus weihaiensis]|uniref:hypothetical protein n=1 Tax=Bacillus weihaiensis TaxID=1547283 RepID=UPI002352C818|nr:hypothetical protein [Bacillus weihaiensis]
MDERIKELVEFTRDKYGLGDYFLYDYELHRSMTIFKETVYTLRMDWFPNHEVNWDDEESTPIGAACIEIDVHSKKPKSIIFVKGVSYADDQRRLDASKRDELVEWIESVTGLTYGKQFEFWKEEEGDVHFKECVDGVAVSPSGSIHIKLDEEGKLTFFSVNGQFPMDGFIERNQFALSLKQQPIMELAKKQLKLVEFPMMKEKKCVLAYAMEEIYVRNDGIRTIPFDVIVDVRSYLPVNQLLEWDNEVKEGQPPFERRPITYKEEIHPDQAFQLEEHPDVKKLEPDEMSKCIEACKGLLRQKYPNDSGEWVVSSLHREKGYIQAILRRVGHVGHQAQHVFQRKLLIFTDPNRFEVVNDMGNELLIDMYKEFKKADDATVTIDEAYEKLKGKFELKPYYVYDFEEERYVLCGKVDCHYAVKASTGEVVGMNEL